MTTLLSVNNYHYYRGGAETVFLRHNELFESIGWRVVPFAMHHPRNLQTAWSRFFIDEIEFGGSYSLSQKMLRDSLDAFSRRDVVLADKVLKQDEEEDRLKAQALTSLIDLLKKDPSHSSQYVDLILLSRNMERIGDHATNVAEDVIFMVQGKDIRHHLDHRDE